MIVISPEDFNYFNCCQINQIQLTSSPKKPLKFHNERLRMKCWAFCVLEGCREGNWRKDSPFRAFVKVYS